MNKYIAEIEEQLEILRKANKDFLDSWRFMNSKDFKFEVVNKYYWILIKETCLTGELTYEKVVDKHPFDWRMQTLTPQIPDLSILILNWKEITKEEYELYQTI